MPEPVIYVTGIGTDVGKTIASAIIVEALGADYWKPIQSGDLNCSDTMKVQSMVSNETSMFHQERYALTKPISPHASASIDGRVIKASEIILPKTDNYLVVEFAGGLLVPINYNETILDLIPPKGKVIVVSRNYLGSINHTLLTVEVLKTHQISFGILFNGKETKTTEEIIEKKTNAFILGRIPELKKINQEQIKTQAKQIREKLFEFLI